MLFYQLMYPYLPYARFFHFNPPSPQNFCCRGVCEHPLPYKESPFFYKGICCDACSQSLWHIHVSYHHMRETTQTSQGKLLATFQSFATKYSCIVSITYKNSNTFMEHFEVIIFKKISWRNHLNFKVKFLSRINLPLWGFQKYEITLAKAAWNVQFQLFEKLLHANYRKHSCISRIFFKHSCISRTLNF